MLSFVLASMLSLALAEDAPGSSAASAPLSSASFARVDVETPDALVPGKILKARVAITMTGVTSALTVEAKAHGTGLLLPLKRRWQFVRIGAGQTITLQLPYQTTKSFHAGEIVLSLSAAQGKQKLPVQTATLSLSK